MIQSLHDLTVSLAPIKSSSAKKRSRPQGQGSTSNSTHSSEVVTLAKDEEPRHLPHRQRTSDRSCPVPPDPSPLLLKVSLRLGGSQKARNAWALLSGTPYHGFRPHQPPTIIIEFSYDQQAEDSGYAVEPLNDRRLT